MENVIYRIDLTEKSILEFEIVDTNEVDPYKEIKAIGITIQNKPTETFATLDGDELKSLIKYLLQCKDHIEKFNSDKNTLK